ncbi:FimB/Mfa2 family fimbrial subunit [Bacteroides hominis]|uniref:FimB/Mfa2 family fimbrial subunit n=1 Tax=Bacteroides fragilis TaxID=817 RepID=A0A0I9S7C8_BACFG|nr:unnamed protein product [Bacteroides hominis (ex Liu et al. 2022)]MCE8567059.1 FimB/Mfa2 family fimbrial subunit [Bacteroides fragilis]MCM0227093.1 FimB/Mfa2 family fimbrial subunit [Bacteroides fragilis]MCM0236607.1 FimB/Mfa2 family fimbrial subunit [Bacteroides fragilis]MDV6193883.1 FimB/Mfa2 family fimbrial subunit [Bacteroides hominis (ex Liu et al. 2022)]QCQ49656.1 hypothetical protein EE52_009660 [Bacteroides fragilis]
MKTTTDIFATLSASPSAFLRRKEVWRHWKWPAFVYLLFLASCTLEYEMRTCPYNVLIHYVTSDGRGFATGDYPVEDFRQFVYTEDSVLVGEFPGDSCEAGVGMLTLPPGTYRLVVWGNAPGGSCRMEEINPHGSRMEDGRLHALSYGGKEASAEYANVGRLYYGTATFKVSKYGVNELTVGLMHAHARLNLTVEWKDDIPAEVRSARSPVMRLRGLHTAYHFCGGETWGDYTFPKQDTGVPLSAYRAAAVIESGFQVKASFVTLRLTDGSRLVLELTEQGEGLMKEIDLSRYFDVMGIGLSRNICQEFDLTVRIGKDQTLIMQTHPSGWQEGGSIGAN